jgi:hypothetical protein
MQSSGNSSTVETLVCFLLQMLSTRLLNFTGLLIADSATDLTVYQRQPNDERITSLYNAARSAFDASSPSPSSSEPLAEEHRAEGVSSARMPHGHTIKAGVRHAIRSVKTINDWDGGVNAVMLVGDSSGQVCSVGPASLSQTFSHNPSVIAMFSAALRTTVIGRSDVPAPLRLAVAGDSELSACLVQMQDESLGKRQTRSSAVWFGW